MSEVLVLGGTGFVGVPLVDGLLSASHAVTVLSRGTARPSFSRPVERLFADRRDPHSVRRAVTGRAFDAVIDNLAFTREDVAQAVETFDGRTRRYVLASSVVVYGRPGPTPVREDAVDLREVPSGAPAPAFGRSTLVGKRQAELVLWDGLSSGRLPFDFTILRPAKIHGRRDPSPRLWWYIQRLHDGGPLVVPDDSPDPLIRHVYCDDLAAAYVSVLDHPRCRNEVYNIASAEVVRLHAVLEAIAAALGRTLAIVRVPRRLMADRGIAEGSHPLVPTGDLIPEVGKAQEHFGWQSTPLLEWIRALCEWYLTQPVEDSWGYRQRSTELDVACRYAH